MKIWDCNIRWIKLEIIFVLQVDFIFYHHMINFFFIPN